MLNSIIIRTKQWWQPKAGNLLSAVYLAVFIFNIDFSATLKFIFPAIATILGIGMFGYFFNDFSDLESDRKANKNNMLEKLNTLSRLLLLVSALILAFVPWLFLPFDSFNCYLLIGEFVLLLVYAVPPIRLKEKGFVALVADALYAYAIPFTLAFHTFNLIYSVKIIWVLYAIIFAWQFSVGLINILIHQIEDSAIEVAIKGENGTEISSTTLTASENSLATEVTLAINELGEIVATSSDVEPVPVRAPSAINFTPGKKSPSRSTTTTDPASIEIALPG